MIPQLIFMLMHLLTLMSHNLCHEISSLDVFNPYSPIYSPFLRPSWPNSRVGGGWRLVSRRPRGRFPYPPRPFVFAFALRGKFDGYAFLVVFIHPPTHVSDRSLKLQDIDCCSQDSTEQLVVLLRQTYPHYHESIMPRQCMQLIGQKCREEQLYEQSEFFLARALELLVHTDQL